MNGPGGQRPGSAAELLSSMGGQRHDNHPRQRPFGKQSQGILDVTDDVFSSTATRPDNWKLLIDWENDCAEACDLQLEVTQAQGTNDSFPPNNFRNYTAGSYYTGGGSTSTDPKGIIKVEFGGFQPRTVYADLANGRFSVGGQEKVRVSVCRWGVATGATTTLRARASIVPSSGDSELLRYSARLTIAAADNETITVPPGARYFEVYPDCSNAGAANAPVLSLSGAVSGKRDLLQGIYYPPSSPLPIQGVSGAGGQTVTVANSGSASVDVLLVFWVQ